MTNPKRLWWAAACAAALSVSSVSAQSLNYLGSLTTDWVVYAGASAVPVFVTGAPGSITDAASAGSSWARSAVPSAGFSGVWKAGETYRLDFDMVVANSTTFRLEFSNTGRTAGLQYVFINGPSAGADRVEVNSFGAPAGLTLHSGNLGGAAGAGSAQRVVGDITFTVLPGATTASVSGSLSDSTGVLWTGSGGTAPVQNLGVTSASLYPAVNVSSGGSATAINSMTWTYTAVPEPGTGALLLLGLAAFGFRRARKGA